MQYTSEFGLAAPELGWVPAPSYVLRRAMLLDRLSSYPVGRVLEIGSGAGALLYDLCLRGFSGVGVESSKAALTVASRLLAGAPRMELAAALPPHASATFDYLLAFEVLEHIEDDRGALALWRQYLKPGGRLLISVPAHKRRWGPSDVWAGHYRRYERTEIVAKVREAGFYVERVESIGWPLSNWIEPIRGWLHAWRTRARRGAGADPEADRRTGTAQSGVERSAETRMYPMYANPLGKRVFALFAALQQRASRMDRGTSHLICAHSSS